MGNASGVADESADDALVGLEKGTEPLGAETTGT
jgi:hypothetical protein